MFGQPVALFKPNHIVMCEKLTTIIFTATLVCAIGRYPLRRILSYSSPCCGLFVSYIEDLEAVSLTPRQVSKLTPIRV